MAPEPVLRLISLVLALLGGAAPASALGQDPDPTFDILELAPGVLAALVVADPPHYTFANSLVVDLGNGVLVVDTQQSPGAASALIAELARRGYPPVRWVVNTHWHGDHVLGNAAYRDAFPDVEFIGHRTLPEDLAARTRSQVDRDIARIPEAIVQMERWLAADTGQDGSPLVPEQRQRLERALVRRRGQLATLRSLELVPPTLLVHDAITIAGPDRVAEILWLGPAHTRGDIIVWLPGERILAAGDLVEDAWPWVEGAHLQGWATALERIHGLQPQVVLPAHGAPWRDPAGRLQVQRTLFHTALSAGCGESPASRPPAVLEHFREALGLPASGAGAFWVALTEAARTGGACGARP